MADKVEVKDDKSEVGSSEEISGDKLDPEDTSGEGDETEVETSTEEETKSEIKPEVSTSDILRRLEVTETKTRDLESENAFLRGQLVRDKKAEKPDDEEEEEEDDEVIAEKLRKDPIKTLRAREERILKKVEKRFNKQTDSQTALQRTVENDRGVAYNEFPELRSNQEFLTLTNTYLEALVKRNGGNYMGGDIPLAARAAAMDLVRAGKLKIGAGENGEHNVKETVRKVESDPLIRTKTSPGTKEDVGKSFILQFDKSTQESIQRTCKKLGVTLEQYAKNYKESKGQSSSYGRD